MPEVLSTARGRTQDQGHSFFSHTDRPSPVNNIFIFFPAVNWFYRVLMHGFVYATIGVCLFVEGRGSRVTGRGSRVNSRGSRVYGRGSRVTSRGSKKF